MTVRAFADTNIPLYALDVDAEKRKKALALLRGNPVISVQVVNALILSAHIVCSLSLVTQWYGGEMGIRRAFTDFLDCPSVNQGKAGD